MRTNQQNCPEYLFVAWRRSQFDTDSYEDTQTLHEIARRATEDAGLTCYWISENCLAPPAEGRRLALDVSRRCFGGLHCSYQLTPLSPGMENQRRYQGCQELSDCSRKIR